MFSALQFIETPSLTADGQRLYYHKKVGDIDQIVA
jgi:hypothetical protein